MQRRLNGNANGAYEVADISRGVFWYVLRSCERPVQFGAFAQSLRARLTRLSPSLVACDPLRAVLLLAHRTLKQQHMRDVAPACTVRLFDACARMRDAVRHLPPPHRFVITALIANDTPVASIAHELRVSSGMVLLYYEQSRAMLRALGSDLHQRNDALSCSANMLLAQSAAYWLCRGREHRHLAPEFASWILISPTHVAELLISCTDQLVLVHALRAHEYR